jgi:hypothetical protein
MSEYEAMEQAAVSEAEALRQHLMQLHADDPVRVLMVLVHCTAQHLACCRTKTGDADAEIFAGAERKLELHYEHYCEQVTLQQLEPPPTGVH